MLNFSSLRRELQEDFLALARGEITAEEAMQRIKGVEALLETAGCLIKAMRTSRPPNSKPPATPTT